MNRRAEAGNHQAALGAVEDVFQARTDGALALGVAGTVDVGGIGQQQQNAALAVFRERVQVEKDVVGRSGIDLEVAGVDDDAEGGGYGQRHRARQSSG